MSIDSKARFKMRKFLSELGKHRARHTELISVYIPSGYDINKVKQQLSGEAGTARNIKSSGTRKNVQDALERMIRALALYKQTPPNGLAIFAGNVAEREGQSDVQLWEIEPPAPLKTKVYKCDQAFFLDPLKEFIDIREAYGLIVIDRQEANIAILKGKAIIPVKDFQSIVPGDTRAGGQCLSPDTLIPSPDGQIFEINNLTNQKMFSFNTNDHIIQATTHIDKWSVTKPKRFTITTKFPKTEISASADHLFFVLSDNGIIEKPAEELTKKDYLLMTEKLNINGKLQKLNIYPHLEYIISKDGRETLKQKRAKLNLLQKDLAKKTNLTRGAISAIEVGRVNPSSRYLSLILNTLKMDFNEFVKKYCSQKSIVKLPKTLTKEFAQILGYLIGDGSIEKERISFAERNQQLVQAYRNKIEKLFNLKSNLRFRESKNYYQLRVGSVALINLIQTEFPEIKKARDTIIPEKICKSEDDVVANFIRGLFDAEGYVSSKLAIGMNNKKLIQQLRLLLLRFGIISSIHKYNNQRNPYSNNPRYTLEIGEKESIQIFAKKIGFESIAKSEKLKNKISTMRNCSYVRRVPVKGSYILKLAKRINLLPRDFPKVSSFFQNKRDMSKLIFEKSIVSIFNKRLAKLNTIESKAVEKELNIIRNSNLIPLRITNIKNSTKNVKLIDISTNAQNFFADGILVHNSAARFSRVRDGMLKDFFRQVADAVNKQFIENDEIKGILLGGPGPNKESFLNGNFMFTKLKEKVIGVFDIGYTGHQGLEELVAKSEDVLAKEEIIKEKIAVNRFMNLLSTKPEFAAYGEEEVRKAIIAGAVDMLLISEDVDEEKIEELAQKCEEFSGEWFVISTDTKEGVLLKNLSGFAAVLRFPIA